MGVRLTDEEVEDFLSNGHTLIMSTIRKSGEPFMVPIWYVWADGAFWVDTLARSKKVEHLRRDPRVCCLVEAGEHWLDLKAVIANCDAEFIEDEATVVRIKAMNVAKYGAFRVDPARMPGATTSHYAVPHVLIKMTPQPGEIRTWYNRKIRLREPT